MVLFIMRNQKNWLGAIQYLTHGNRGAILGLIEGPIILFHKLIKYKSVFPEVGSLEFRLSLQIFNQNCHAQAAEQGGGELETVVGVELQFGQQIAAGDAQKGAGAEGQGAAQK